MSIHCTKFLHEIHIPLQPQLELNYKMTPLNIQITSYPNAKLVMIFFAIKQKIVVNSPFHCNIGYFLSCLKTKVNFPRCEFGSVVCVVLEIMFYCPKQLFYNVSKTSPQVVLIICNFLATIKDPQLNPLCSGPVLCYQQSLPNGSSIKKNNRFIIHYEF